MEGKCKQAVLSLPAQTMTERNLKSDQECETLMTVEKESTMAILAMEESSRKETNLEERYGIMVGAENKDGQSGNPRAEESFQQAHLLNNSEIDMLSEIQAPEAAETFSQEHEQDNGNLVGNDDGEEDINEFQNDGDEAGDGEEDYFFPTPEDAEQARPPEIGMIFATLQDAHRFLNVYGLVTGFVMKKGTNYKHKKITFVCNKSGKMPERGTGNRKRRSNAIDRTECRMKVTVKLVAGRWEIRAVNKEHNHPLVGLPSLTKFLISHKYMSEEERILSRILQESKIKPAEIMEIFRKLRSRLKNIPVQKMDNCMKQSERQAVTKNTDIESTLEHLRRFQKEQPGFIYAINTDNSNTVRSVFWTDALARLNYALYGDFISFDTSYTTTENNMLFAPLIGINGHGKAIVFGCALLENEMAETLTWLFRTFLDVMDGKKPITIITHQGSAMQKSTAEAFPDASHRFSMWHMMREAAAEFGGSMANRSGLQAELTRLVTNSLTAEEFEDGWKAMLQKYDAASNAHLNLMYQTRLMWVPVYFKHVFSPFIRSSEGSDNTNSIFKDDVPLQDTIENLIHQYDIFQKEVACMEHGYRSQSTPKIPMYCTRQPIERQAAELYTVGLFLKFQKELLDASAFNVFETDKGRIYTVKKTLDYEEAEFLSDSFPIEVDMKTNMFNCVCSKFERDGILCCHVLRLFTQFGINEIPQHYIKQRWTKKYREEGLLIAQRKQDWIVS